VIRNSNAKEAAPPKATRSGKAHDVLFIVGELGLDELEAVLKRTRRLLRDGGELVVRLALIARRHMV
jgi:precorrin-6B methylase 2